MRFVEAVIGSLGGFGDVHDRASCRNFSRPLLPGCDGSVLRRSYERNPGSGNRGRWYRHASCHTNHALTSRFVGNCVTLPVSTNESSGVMTVFQLTRPVKRSSILPWRLDPSGLMAAGDAIAEQLSRYQIMMEGQLIVKLISLQNGKRKP